MSLGGESVGAVAASDSDKTAPNNAVSFSDGKYLWTYYPV